MESKPSHIVTDYLVLNSDISLTPIHINKLAFFCHGWKLGIVGKPLINEKVQAWEYGTVFPSIYHSFKIFKSKEIDKNEYFKFIKEPLDSLNNTLKDIFYEKELEIIDQVIKDYSQLSTSELIGITHEKDSPWDKYYVLDKHNIVIPDDEIKEYYKEQIHMFNKNE